MGTLSGAVGLLFSFSLHSQWESTLKRKNLLLKEQILSFESRLRLKGFCCSGKQTEIQNRCHLYKNGGRAGRCSFIP